jgi:hypothetical protein
MTLDLDRSARSAASRLIPDRARYSSRLHQNGAPARGPHWRNCLQPRTRAPATAGITTPFPNLNKYTVEAEPSRGLLRPEDQELRPNDGTEGVFGDLHSENVIAERLVGLIEFPEKL